MLTILPTLPWPHLAKYLRRLSDAIAYFQRQVNLPYHNIVHELNPKRHKHVLCFQSYRPYQEHI